MKTRTRALAFTALATAGAMVMLYLGLLFPAMALTFAALAAVFVTVTVIEGGLYYGLFCFVATSILGLVLAPGASAMLYIFFLGGYPLVKSIAEARKSRILEWVIKYAAFFVGLLMYMTILRYAFLAAVPFAEQAIPIIIVGGAVVFLVYDIGMSKLIGLYLARIYKHRNGGSL